MSVLADLIRGRGAHADPVFCFQGLSPEQAGTRVSGAPHTIWQLLGHLNYWMSYQLGCIEGPELPAPTGPAESWPHADGPPDQRAWREELSRFRGALDQLAALADARASTLARIAHHATSATVETVLWQLVAHNSYHVGQVVLLRQALGVWPPATGAASR